LAVDDSCLCCAFLPPYRLRTRERVPHLALPMPLVATALVPPLPHSSQRLDNDPYRDPVFYILYTTLPLEPLAKAPFPILNSASLNIGFVSTHVFVELPTLDHVLEFYATSSLFLMLQLGLRFFTVIVSSLDVVSTMSQTMHSVVHLSASC